MVPPLVAAALFAVALTLLPAGEDQPTISAHLGDVPTLVVPRATTVPRLTADPEDPAWAEAATVTDLSGGAPAAPTTWRVLWSPEALYLRCLAVDSGVEVPFGDQRDAEHLKGDAAWLVLDPLGDGKVWYDISVNPAGGFRDLVQVLSTDPLSEADGGLTPAVRGRDWWSVPGWNARHVTTVGRATADGWVVDIAIGAIDVMRRSGEKIFAPGPLRLNLMRQDWLEMDGNRTSVVSTWSPVRQGAAEWSPLAMGLVTLAP